MSSYQFKREPLSIEETDRLINACEDFTDRLIVTFLLETGCRVGELCALTKDSVYWQEGKIMVYGKGGPFGKKSKRRTIPMTDNVKALLEVLLIRGSQTTLGLKVRTVQHRIKKIANRAGITRIVTPHVLRHTYAVKCIRDGMSSRIVQALLGHDRLTTTEIYLNISPVDVDRVFRERWR